jgi:isopentenyl-diphosphate delta-isomerase
MNSQERVILVDECDIPVGDMEKMEAHEKGLLHRAISVFIINSKGQILLQQRAAHKYHSGGLWTNTCCTHPRLGESCFEAANRRLDEEMGMMADLHEAFFFIYKAELDHGLIEHEFDHVFIGFSDEVPVPNPEEVSAFKWMTVAEIQNSIQETPKLWTEWFKVIFTEFQSELGKELSLSAI